MKTIQTIVYDFSELSPSAKLNAIEEWYKNEDYPFLSNDIYEKFTELADQHGIEYDDIDIYYSLTYRQGDGLCVIGTIRKGNKSLFLKHHGHYCHAKSVEMMFTNDGEEIDGDDELEDIYFDICRELEKYGYSILEYRMDENEFNELCEANEYTFLPSGKMKNY